ncbi:creatininase family protein [Gluconacetobacter aggeris]|uniref:Creatininase family protein n=2 Tax=Gluconacetobacter aggeris TaxID=1286186 RepID=A0A7W4IVW8_9PROT|nr:creatininase family protein [Gluconacetobacter aggeris]
MRWANATSVEIDEVLGNMEAAILPVGATEQHGPHLGCGTDFVIAEELCAAVSAATGVPMLPVLPYGCSLGHSRQWPGTISLLPETLMDLVEQIVDWAHSAGVLRMFIVNAHVTNAAPLRCAVERLRARHNDLMLAIVNTATMTTRVRDAFCADAEDWHANEAETSLMQAISSALVRPELFSMADDPDRTTSSVFIHPVNRTSRNGVTGRPSISSLERGQILFDWMIEDLTDIVRRGLVETPPLDVPYNPVDSRPSTL